MPDRARSAPALPVFRASLALGCSAFGGPIAHLGIFRTAYVERRGWIDAQGYGGIVALCQMLPGPTSSQVGFLVGWHRAGWRGALAAWLGFTLPSAVLMYLFALAAPRWQGAEAHAVLHGLKLAAVAVVAQAVWAMARSLCPDLRRAAIAAVAATVMLAGHGAWLQLAVLAAAAGAGVLLLRARPATALIRLEVGAAIAVPALLAFGVLLAASTAVVALAPHTLVNLAAVIYRCGALVFGGGHVVLPLLREALVPAGWAADDVFLSGYGAAQALPGPLFTFAAFLGASAAPAGATLAWAGVALVAIFVPGLLVALAGAWLWSRVASQHGFGGALAGLNAAVVGILAAALYDPVATTGVTDIADGLIAVGGVWLLQWRRVAPLLVVAICVGISLVRAQLFLE